MLICSRSVTPGYQLTVSTPTVSTPNAVPSPVAQYSKDTVRIHMLIVSLRNTNDRIPRSLNSTTMSQLVIYLYMTNWLMLPPIHDTNMVSWIGVACHRDVYI